MALATPRPARPAALLALVLLGIAASGCASWTRVSTRLVEWPPNAELPDQSIDAAEVSRRANAEIDRLPITGLFAEMLAANEIDAADAGLRYTVVGKKDRIWGSGGDIIAVLTVHPPIWLGGKLTVRFDAEANGSGSDDSPTRKAWEAFLIALEIRTRDGLERAVKGEPPPAPDEEPADEPAPRGP